MKNGRLTAMRNRNTRGRRSMKKWVLIFLSIVMMLVLAVPALAETGTAEAAQGAAHYAYTVEFTYDGRQYVMQGDSSFAISEILPTLDLTGEVTAVEISDESLFSASNENGEWIVTAHQPFSTTEWMKVTINGLVYEITVTDDTAFSGGNGTEGDPYQIKTVADMTALAVLANDDSSINHEATKGKYFKLMNDITYNSSDDFTPIGKDDVSNRSFNGTFDGDGHTIRGIKATDSSYCGLFGYIYKNGTVKNVTVDQATICGGAGVGGIAGKVNYGSKIENCFVTNSTISGSYSVGAISGYGIDTFSNNFYVSCSVTVGSEAAKTSNVGCGDSGDFDGARQAYAAAQESLCKKMTDKEIYIGGTTEITPVYYDFNNGNAVSISPTVTFNGEALDASKYTVTVKDSTNQDVTSNVTAEGIYTLTVSGVNSEGYYGSASTTIAVGVGLPVTAGSTKLTTGTYAVNDTLEITERIKIDGNVKLILSAGKTLTARKGIDVDRGNSLTIEGEGTLIATGEEYNSGIGGSIGGSTHRASGTITINSGTVTSTGGNYAAGIGGSFSTKNLIGACDNGTVIINGGVVTANGGIHAPGIGGGSGEDRNGGDGGIITITGGQVTANAGSYNGGYTSCGMGPGGVYQDNHTEGAAATITLGWTDSAKDFIQATSYKTASFAAGKIFVLENTDTVAKESNWSGKKLVPYDQPATNIDSAVISGVDALYPYSESGVTIAPTVTLVEATLMADNDYTVSYKLNGTDVGAVKEIGTYTLTVTGTGSYSGSVSTTFRVVHAKTVINYQAYESGELKGKTLAADGYTSVTSETTAMTGGWYVVQDDFTVADRITTSGDVRLVLCNGATLTAEKGISVRDGNSLTIYGQDGNTGKLVANGWDEQISDAEQRRCAGIGGDGWGLSGSETAKAGTIIIHGGDITATGAYDCAGIGRAYTGTAGAITIYGGKVTGTCNTYGGTGIGGSGATIHLGWANQTSDYIEASGYEGSVTFDKVFVLNDDHNVMATAANAGGKKIVPLDEASVCTVTFDSKGGSAVAEQKVVKGQATPEPGKPMNQGFKFCGWYIAEDCSGTAYGFAAAVNSDFTLHAKWEAVSAISYVGTDGEAVRDFMNYTPLESNYTTLPAGTYFVGENTTIESRITVKDEVNLILGDGATLTASEGIAVNSGNTLSIFCQSGGTGALKATAKDNYAGIGGNYGQSVSGTVRIYGGVITATGGACGAGIGGSNACSNGAVYIYGGTVTANAGGGDSGQIYSAAIGGGQLGNGGIISILGGQVTAIGGSNDESIGIGYQKNSIDKTATITLGYKAETDFIKASGYNGTVTVETDKKFMTDDSPAAEISGTVNDNADINGKKLTPKKCSVSFDLGGAEGTAPVSQEGLLCGIDKAEKPSSDPTRTGYIFGGWKKGGTAYDFTSAVTGDLTLTADWTEKTTINPVVSIIGWKYGETANAPGIESGNLGNGKASYAYYTNEGCTVKTTEANSGAETEGGVPKNAGKYYVKATVAETDEYQSGTGKAEFTISKAIRRLPLSSTARRWRTATSAVRRAVLKAASCGRIRLLRLWCPTARQRNMMLYSRRQIQQIITKLSAS